MAEIAQNVESYLMQGKQIATGSDRFWALFIDYLCIVGSFFLTLFIIFLITYILDFIKQNLGYNNSGYVGAILLIGYCIGIGYYLSQAYHPYAQTIGERAMKIKMIPLNQEKISLRVAIKRIFFICVPLLNLASICLVNIDNRQSYLDMLCDTVTIKEG
jgi:uncharacterized RDD family membrane protein YckC